MRRQPQGLDRFTCHARVTQAHVGDLDNRLAVGIHQRIGNHVGFGAIADFLDRHFIGHNAGRHQHLAAAFEATDDAGYGFQPYRALFCHPAQAQQVHAQCVQATLEHQRAGHHLIIDEMASKEPVICMDIRFTAHQAQTEAPTVRVEMRDAVYQAHASAGQSHRLRHR